MKKYFRSSELSNFLNRVIAVECTTVMKIPTQFHFNFSNFSNSTHVYQYSRCARWSSLPGAPKTHSGNVTASTADRDHYHRTTPWDSSRIGAIPKAGNFHSPKDHHIQYPSILWWINEPLFTGHLRGRWMLSLWPVKRALIWFLITQNWWRHARIAICGDLLIYWSHGRRTNAVTRSF